jgi:predicted dehydrogenase/nucleoside-diphosphate-sugar epimerase
MGLHHLKAIAAAGRTRVVGIADPAADMDALGPLLPPDAIVVADAAEMLERAKPDVVHIVTPPATHAPLAELAIRAGCHIYVEKPFTLTKEDASRVMALAAERNVTVCAGHQVLFEPPALAAMDALASIGRMVHVTSYFSFKMVRRTITAADQAKDILPHAIYPVVDQLRAGTGLYEEPIELVGLSVTAGGEVYALLKLGAATAVVLVTLNGRPVEQYQEIVGTNGSVRPDYIGGGVTLLAGPGTGPGVLLTPFRRSFRMFTGTVGGIVRLLKAGGNSYPGLRLLVARFYDSIRGGTAPPLTARSIIDTVDICEQIGAELDVAERSQETAARARLDEAEARLGPPRADRPLVLLTGGTGLLGRRTAEELRQAGIPVRVAARRIPPPSRRVAGVEYVAADLARGIDPAALVGVGMVVHCAAETAGGKLDHQRNSVDATRLLLEAAVAAGVKRAVHISSVAVLKTFRELGRPIDESAPVDLGNLQRGPYVWGKAESERIVQQVAGLDVRIIRPGPLVDYAAFQPPGRLGREIGPWYVAVGPKAGLLSVCDVTTAARVIRLYVEDFGTTPPVVNLVEAPAPTRGELMQRFLNGRPDLGVFWLPGWVLSLLSGPLKLLQRVALGSKQPVDVAAAFAAEPYRSDLAAQLIQRAPGADAAVPESGVRR